MSRKSRNRRKLELVPNNSADAVLEPDAAKVHRLTGELHDTLEAIISGCALLMPGPMSEALLNVDSEEFLEPGDDLDSDLDPDDDSDDALEAELSALDADIEVLGDALGGVATTTRALARTLLARLLHRNLPHAGPLPLPSAMPLSRENRNAAIDEAAFVLREVGLEEFDVWSDLVVDPDGTAEVFVDSLPPETAHISLLEFLFERAESVARSVHPLMVAERDASSWEFSRWSVSPPPGTRSPEAADFSRHVREQEYSLAERGTITLGASVIGELAADDIGFGEMFPRQHRLARALDASFVDVFECVALDGNRATLKSVRDARTYDVREHMEPIEYATGWICMGRLLPFGDTLHLRSPGMIFLQPGDPDLVRNATDALETLGRTLPPALALEGMISSVVFGVSVPRTKKPAPTRAAARETLVALSAVLADPEFAHANTDPTLKGFLAALTEQAEAGGARSGQQKARRAKKAKRRR